MPKLLQKLARDFINAHNKRLHRTNFTVTFFALRGKKAANKICSVSRALHNLGKIDEIKSNIDSSNITILSRLH
jgi:hypothetical protein